MVSTFALNDGQLFVVVLSLFWFALFILSRVFRWDEITYEQFKDSRIMWYWLDTFGVPRTRENCLRFLLVVWIGGVLLASVFTISALRSGG